MADKPTLPSVRKMHMDWELQALKGIRSPVQIEEMGKAFYSGAYALFRVLENILPDLTEYDGIQYLDELSSELTQYFERIMKRG